MEALIILDNTFYAFWFLLKDYFMLLLAYGVLVVLFLAIYYLLIKR